MVSICLLLAAFLLAMLYSSGFFKNKKSSRYTSSNDNVDLFDFDKKTSKPKKKLKAAPPKAKAKPKAGAAPKRRSRGESTVPEGFETVANIGATAAERETEVRKKTAKPKTGQNEGSFSVVKETKVYRPKKTSEKVEEIAEVKVGAPNPEKVKKDRDAEKLKREEERKQREIERQQRAEEQKRLRERKICFNCGREGHVNKECPLKAAQQEEIEQRKKAKEKADKEKAERREKVEKEKKQRQEAREKAQKERAERLEKEKAANQTSVEAPAAAETTETNTTTEGQ